jgi:LacI family transcriptional regulator
MVSVMPTARARPTMREVAALAGVSIKTVSRVVNGEPTVAADLAERVQRAADQLGFRPNLAASALRRSDGRTRTIGLLLEDIANPFSSTLHRAVEDVARSHGVGVLAASIDEQPERERELVSVLSARRVDGLILVPSGDDQGYLAAEQEAGMAMVFADRRPNLVRADAVVCTNRLGARQAVEHLLRSGHRRIAHLGDRLSIETAVERHAGYVDALTAAGLLVDPVLVRDGLHDRGAAEAAAGDLLDAAEPPTAIFASQNLITVGTIRALRARGLQHRVALVGFDEVELADLLEPGVTVVAQDIVGIGRRAAELLFARMDGSDEPVAVHEVPTRLITRGSGEIAPPTVPAADATRARAAARRR